MRARNLCRWVGRSLVVAAFAAGTALASSSVASADEASIGGITIVDTVPASGALNGILRPAETSWV